MNPMTKIETIVMNLTGCSRQIANTVVNAILEEDMRSNMEEDVVYRIYYKKNGTLNDTCETFGIEFDASQRCNWLNENTLEGVFGRYIYRKETRK